MSGFKFSFVSWVFYFSLDVFCTIISLFQFMFVWFISTNILLILSLGCLSEVLLPHPPTSMQMDLMHEGVDRGVCLSPFQPPYLPPPAPSSPSSLLERCALSARKFFLPPFFPPLSLLPPPLLPPPSPSPPSSRPLFSLLPPPRLPLPLTLSAPSCMSTKSASPQKDRTYFNTFPLTQIKHWHLNTVIDHSSSHLNNWRCIPLGV